MGLYRVLSALIYLVALLAQPPSVFAGAAYTDISLHYYNEFFQGDNGAWSTRNFQRYHILRQGYQNNRFDLSFNFNLYEKVSGPLADHNITPYTVEGTIVINPAVKITSTAMVLVTVYNRESGSVLQHVLDSKCLLTRRFNGYEVTLIPGLWVTDENGWRAKPTLGARVATKVGPGDLVLGINTLDTKDHLLLADGNATVSAGYQWPTWGGNEMAVSAHANIGDLQSGQRRVWVDFRVFFDHWFKAEFN